MNPHGRLRVHAALGIEPEPASGLETTPGWFSRFWHIDSEQNELAHLKPLALAAGRATVGVQTHCHAGSKTVPRLNPPLTITVAKLNRKFETTSTGSGSGHGVTLAVSKPTATLGENCASAEPTPPQCERSVEIQVNPSSLSASGNGSLAHAWPCRRLSVSAVAAPCTAPRTQPPRVLRVSQGGGGMPPCTAASPPLARQTRSRLRCSYA
eukprot:CAMPEP_0202856018 /NCGR_PEP_ID=MMETSP1389-20130828/91819_1 /ASSEMBLY_ACC=CAM_ASM_000865 /TAXON_ID=302021 /ORGANISM="Rhodomonas sp., Strain CCMP768" /LENGTH=209 /DNA_ID=CAMNT_0049534657 /DNA_START=97 /DNA_END=725 /DNA_ORIENTATION=-